MTALPDLDAFDDDELLTLAEEAQQIVSRRNAATAIPTQISSLAREYRERGGDQDTLLDAVSEPDERQPG